LWVGSIQKMFNRPKVLNAASTKSTAAIY